jgi:hypothetical protein
MTMGKSYKPSSPFDVAMKLLIPTETKVKGVTQKTFPDPASVNQIFFGSFRTFGGTELTVNDVFTIEDTATIDTWYNPEVTADCQIYLCETGEKWEVVGRPENIDMRHQYMQIKVKKIGGKP